MTDIVDWLRYAANEHNMYRCDEAADEIERLREALKSISKIPNSESAYGIIQVFVDDALKEKE